MNTWNPPHISISFFCSFPNGHFPLFAFCYCLFRIASICRYFLLTLHFSSFFNIFYFTIILITFYFTYKFFVLYYFILLPFKFFQWRWCRLFSFSLSIFLVIYFFLMFSPTWQQKYLSFLKKKFLSFPTIVSLFFFFSGMRCWSSRTLIHSNYMSQY